MSAPKPLHIFKAGTHTAMSGQALSFSDMDLALTALAYDPALHEAPLVVGHPQSDAPAYGWVRGLVFDNDALQAEPHQVDPAFAELVTAGRYKKISASFYLPDAPSNPVPGVYYLRHVGFLGAQPPAIKGLKPAEFAAAEDGIVEFAVFAEAEADAADQLPMGITEEAPPFDPETETEPETGDAMSAEDHARLAVLEEENRILKQQQAEFVEAQARAKLAAAHAAHLAFAEGLVAEGRLLPAQSAVTVAMLDYLARQDDPIEFGEGDAAVPLIDAVKSGLLSQLPKQIEFGEIAPASADKAPGTATLAQHQAKWDADTALRAEFGEFENYVAFAKAEADGLVSIKR